MPELPEVETVRRVLLKSIIDRKIIDIEIRYEGIINNDVSFFKENIIGKTFKNIDRCGKFLIFKLDEGNIISHLRMEGKYFYLKNGEIDNKHIHVIYKLDNGYSLYYQDVRKFGRMEYKTEEMLYNSEPLLNVGVDLTNLNKKIDYRFFYDRIVLRSVPIKNVLLDQSIICGLGNIYVDEVLFLSNVNPNRPANSLSFDEVKAICDSTKEILLKAIECGGTTIRSYTSSLGVSGTYQNYLLVHTKAVCPNCNKKLNKEKINGRSTYYCINCQR